MTALAASLALLVPFAWSAEGQSDDAKEQPAPASYDTIWELLTDKYDANHDGVITKKEYGKDKEHWKRLDVDGNGKLTREDVESGKAAKAGREKLKGKPPAKAPRKGSKAPNFTLEVVADVTKLGHQAEAEGETPKKPNEGAKANKPETVELSSFRGERPVALIFGSYT